MKSQCMLLVKAITWAQPQEVLEGGDIGLTGRQVDVRDVAAAHVRAAEVHRCRTLKHSVLPSHVCTLRKPSCMYCTLPG